MLLFLINLCYSKFVGIFCESVKTLHPTPNVFHLISSAEIEAKEACTWLRAAGFPQYAQLYEGKAPWDDPTHFPTLECQ